MKKKKNILILLLILAVTKVFSQSVDHWETIIQVGDSCKYHIPTSDLGKEWRMSEYDDGNWVHSKSGVGYGDNDDSTKVAEGTLTVYMRFHFNVHSKSDIASLLLDIDYDDGFIAYLNGGEIARANIENPVSWDMELNTVHEAGLYKGGMPERFDVSGFIQSYLVEGENVLVIEVHNESSSSSDMSSNVFLHAGITQNGILYQSTPLWFWEPEEVNLEETNLPIMIINTGGQLIPDEPRISADMGLIFNGEGQINHIGDIWNEYSGKISIEQRGESSSGFAKKSYSIELQKADGSNNNVSILGLPEENDFVLYGPYSDKTMIKNVLTYELYRKTGRWAPRTRFIEVMLNDDYRGVYVLTEKLKRDENRVDIDKITSADVLPEDMSGGYILRRDKNKNLPEDAPWWWTSTVEQPYHQRMWYEYVDPAYEELTNSQTDYIKDWMHQFDEMMSGPEFSNPTTGYRNYITVNSFIDMMFINEISKGIDNYMFSTYFYKENDSDGGRFVAGPPWDYNIGYGNVNYGESWEAAETYGWCYPQGSRTYWYERLMEDEHYRNKVYCRWSDFRNGIYSDESVTNIIDSCLNVLAEAADRNFTQYPTLGQYVWPAISPFPDTYQGEVDNLKTWLLARLEWMDNQWAISGTCTDMPPDDIALSNNTIQMDASANSVVGRLMTIDQDSDEHTYSLVPGEGGDDNGVFIIVGNKLRLSDTYPVNMKKSTYSTRIRSEDDRRKSIEKVFIIHAIDDVVSGIEDRIHDAFTLFPNPTTGTVQIMNTGQNQLNYEVCVNNLSGRQLFIYTGKLDQINADLYRDSGALASGIYLMKINAGGQMKTTRFVKL